MAVRSINFLHELGANSLRTVVSQGFEQRLDAALASRASQRSSAMQA